MTVVAVVNEKGGVSKTTIVAHLGLLAQLDGLPAVIVDADQSGSLKGFIDDRKAANKPIPTLLVANDYDNPERLREAVRRAKAAGAAWIFIDTAAGLNSLHSVAAELADIVLIPTLRGRQDNKVTANTARLVRKLGKAAYLVISQGSQSKAINDGAAIGLSTAFKIPAISTHLVRRQPIDDAKNNGDTVFDLDSKEQSVEKARADFRALWHWLRDEAAEVMRSEDGAQEGQRVEEG